LRNLIFPKVERKENPVDLEVDKNGKYLKAGEYVAVRLFCRHRISV